MFSVTEFRTNEPSCDSKMYALINVLYATGRGSEVEKAIYDSLFREKLYKEFAAIR